MTTAVHKRIYTFRSHLASQLIILGIVSLVIGISFIFPGKYVSAGILISVGILILTVRSGIGIDLNNKKIMYLKSIFGIEYGKGEPYEELQSIGIKSATYSQTMNTRANTSTFTYELYTLCLIADEEVVELKSSKNRDKLEKHLKNLSTALNLPIIQD